MAGVIRGSAFGTPSQHSALVRSKFEETIAGHQRPTGVPSSALNSGASRAIRVTAHEQEDNG